MTKEEVFELLQSKEEVNKERLLDYIKSLVDADALDCDNVVDEFLCD